MFRNDYIMRMIEQLCQALVTVLKRKKEAKYEDAFTVLDELMRDIFGLSSMALNALAYEDLVTLIKLDGPEGSDKAIILAVIMKEEADLYHAQGQYTESYARYVRSFDIFLRVQESGEKVQLREYFANVDEILDKLGEFNLPEEMQHRIFRYYELNGNYAKCEDTLYDLLESLSAEDVQNNGSEAKGEVKELIEKGIAFYQRLLQKSDEDLEKGNLPRSEVEETLAEWHHKASEQNQGMR